MRARVTKLEGKKRGDQTSHPKTTYISIRMIPLEEVFDEDEDVVVTDVNCVLPKQVKTETGVMMDATMKTTSQQVLKNPTK
jgi:hypothetical protein